MLCSATKSSMVPRLTAYILLILIDSWLVHVSLLCRCFSSARGERLDGGWRCRESPFNAGIPIVL